MPDLSKMIKEAIGESSYATWLANASIRIDAPNRQECEVTISVAEQTVADRINTHLHDRILRACEIEYKPAIVTVNVKVDPKLEPCGLRQFQDQNNQSEPPKPEPKPKPKPERKKAREFKGAAEEADYRSRQIKAKHEEADIIVAAVCSYMAVPRSQVMSQRRPRPVAMARAFCAHFLYRDVLMSYPEIAQYFGRANHSTFIDCIRRIDRYLSNSALLVRGFVDPTTKRPVTAYEIIRGIKLVLGKASNTTNVTSQEVRDLCFRHGLDRVVILQFSGARVEQIGYARTGVVPNITEWQ